MTVAIVTDSTTDFSPESIARNGWDVVPMFVCFGSERFRDGVELKRPDFYNRMRTAKELPVTEPPTAEMFEQAFAKQTAAGHEVVAPVMSSKLSQTYAAALEASKKFGGRVHVFDTKTLSCGVGLIAQSASLAAKAGADAATILAQLERQRETQRGFATIPDLSHIGRTGRLNKAQVALGTLMKVIPILRFDKSGTIEGEAQTRTFEKAQELLVDIAARHTPRPAATRICIAHTNDAALGRRILEAFRLKLPAAPKELTLYEAGPAVAANAGAGSVAIFSLQD
ncbi:MAG: DegV family protein [Candidatus Eremiobacteraeota bacterium]|nr:DegV family protein [Candidatus Eremiobacteraeota bacterium]